MLSLYLHILPHLHLGGGWEQPHCPEWPPAVLSLQATSPLGLSLSWLVTSIKFVPHCRPFNLCTETAELYWNGSCEHNGDHAIWHSSSAS